MSPQAVRYPGDREPDWLAFSSVLTWELVEE